MTIPATRSAAWAIVGMSEKDRKKITHKPEAIAKLIEAVEREFELPAGIIEKRNGETGRPLKKCNGYSLSDIRKALILRLNDETANHLNDIGPMVGIDRTTTYKVFPVALRYRETNNPAFMAVYERVKQIPF